MTKILIVDDNRQMTSILDSYAKKDGYETIIAFDGEEALAKFQQSQPDILLLDVMMPKMDGFEVCRTIRKTSSVPIIMITARGDDFEKIMGLDIGADDYMVKPFSPKEVMARVRAVLRRLKQIEAANNNPDKKASKNGLRQVLLYDNLLVDLIEFKVAIGDQPILLTKREIEILWTLATNRNKVFSRENLLSSVWGYDYYGDIRTVDSHIKRLRSKIDCQPHPNWEIKTIWGVGYKFEVLNNV